MLHGRWTDENLAALEHLIQDETAEPKIAVFDWDNTCVRGDISDAVFHQLCSDLAFRFDAPGFVDWLMEARCQDLVSPALGRFLSDPSEGNKNNLCASFEVTRKALHESMDDTSAWAWDTGAFIGWTETEVKQYTKNVINQELARGLRTEVHIGNGAEPPHLVLRPEMKELTGKLMAADWQVWILSASPQWQVEEFASLYDVPPSRVVGMRREITQGKITLQVIPPVSFSDGKLDAYRTFISREYPPLLVAGDSLGDWKLLEASDKVRLLVEPVPSALREFAEWRRSAGEAWLFQAFD